jgi:site-specific recombinase XerD
MIPELSEQLVPLRHDVGAWRPTRSIGDIRVAQLTPVHIAAYIEQLGKEPRQRSINPLAKSSIKQQLAAIRMLFDYLVIGR